MGDVIINGATIAIVSTIVGALVLVIKTLYNMLIGRMLRAENQVDTLLPITNSIVTSLNEVKDELKNTNESFKGLHDDIEKFLKRGGS